VLLHEADGWHLVGELVRSSVRSFVCLVALVASLLAFVCVLLTIERNGHCERV
jgi:hypothetical protein